jgi:hypothetical protein
VRKENLVKIVAILLCAFLTATVWPLAGATHLPAPSPQKPEELAQKSAEAWLALTDSGKYAESWDEAAEYFKSAVSKEKWIDAMKSVRVPLGAVQSRRLKGAKYSKTLPGAPAGEYVVIQYDTSIERKQSAVETITPTSDKDGKWRVVGYYIH